MHILVLIIIVLGFAIIIGGPEDTGKEDPQKEAAERKEKVLRPLFAQCRAIVSDGMDRDNQLSVREHSYYYSKCLEVGPTGFAERVASGVFNDHAAQMHKCSRVMGVELC